MSEGDLLIRVDPERIGASGIRTVQERCFDPGHRSLTLDRWWDECQYRAGLFERGEVEPRFGVEAAIGTAVHAGAAASLLGEPEPIARLLEAALAHDKVRLGDRDLDAAHTKAARLFDLWDRDVRPRWQATGVYAVEWELHVEIGGATYHMHPDVVLADGAVRDLKTSEKRLADGRATTDYQLTVYSYAIWRVFGHLPDDGIPVGLDGLIYTNPPTDIRAVYPDATKPWWDRQEAVRTEAHFRAFEEDVRRREAARSFARATGIYQTNARAGGPDYVCGRCEARDACPAWRGYEWAGKPQQHGSETNAA